MLAEIFKINKRFLLAGFFVGLFFIFLFNIEQGKADFSACGITPTSPLWQAKASDDAVVLTVDSLGNLDIAATTVQTNTAPPASGLTNTFIIKNSTTNKFAFNKINAYISGAALPDSSQADIDNANGDDLMVKNSSNINVARFDATTGNIYFKGKLCGVANATAITTCQELINIKNNLSGNYEIKNDIDCTGYYSFNFSIGSASNPFTGILDGKGFTVANIDINRAVSSYLGLFGYTSSATIRNLKLSDIRVSGRNYVGGLAAYIKNSAIDNVTVFSSPVLTYSIIADRDIVGGLVAVNDNSTISNSHVVAGRWGGVVNGGSNGSRSTVSDGEGNGGLVGVNRGTIINSSAIISSGATGKLTGWTGPTGGLVGTNSGSISNSYASGIVEVGASVYEAGGLVGLNIGNISNSYAASTIQSSGNSYIGGLIGRNNCSGAVPTISYSYSSSSCTGSCGYARGFIGSANSGGKCLFNNSYWDKEVFNNSACYYANNQCVNVTGGTTNQMKTQAQTLGTYSLWDTANIWKVQDGSYPCLRGITNGCN